MSIAVRRFLATVAGCGLSLYVIMLVLSEMAYQAAWHPELSRAAHEVGLFHSTYARLPASIGEVLDDPRRTTQGAGVLRRSDGSTVREFDLFQYRPSLNEGFQIWFTRSDLDLLSPKSKPRGVAPAGRDVWCSFDSTGAILECSRFWCW